LTPRLADFLSAKIGSKVEIEKVRFSLLGNLSIEQLRVWDPDNHEIISAQEINVTSDFFDLLSGNFIFGEIHLSGVNAYMEQRNEGLNIQFILDAFTTTGSKETTSSVLTLIFNKVLLENISFDYNSVVNGSSISIHLEKCTGDDATYSTNPDKLKVDVVSVESLAIHMLNVDTTDVNQIMHPGISEHYFTPDFGLGIQLEINKLDTRHSAFSYHTNKELTTLHFDPSHMLVYDIQFTLTDILVYNDTLALKIDTLSGRLPAFNLNKAQGKVQMNHDKVELTGFNLKADYSEVYDLSGVYEVKPTRTDTKPGITLRTRAKINLADFTYFISDSMMATYQHLNSIYLTLTGDYMNGTGSLDTLSVLTGNSQFFAAGSINDIWNTDKLSWRNLSVRSTVGPEFRKTLVTYVDESKLPPDLKIEMITTGSLKKMFIDGHVKSTWGNLSAKGEVSPLNDNIKMDMKLTGQSVNLNHWMEIPWLGPADFALKVDGVVGNHLDVDISGEIQTIELKGESIEQVALQSHVTNDSVIAEIAIRDPEFEAKGQVEIAYAGQIHAWSQIQLDSFRVGELLNLDTTLTVSGMIHSDISFDDSTLQSMVQGEDILIQRNSIDIVLDTLSLNAWISNDSSHIVYFTSDGNGQLSSDFDVRTLPAILQAWSKNTIGIVDTTSHVVGNRSLEFDFQLDKPAPLQLLGMDIEQFASLEMEGVWDEQKQIVDLEVTSGKFKGFGISLDTIHTDLTARGDSITSMMKIGNLFYNSIDLGEMDFSLFTTGDTAVSRFSLSKDTVAYIGLGARMLRTAEGINIYPDTLQTLGRNYFFDKENPIRIEKGKFIFDKFQLYRDSMHIRLDGDMNAFDVNFRNLELTHLNSILEGDSIIDAGYLTGDISFVQDQKLKLEAHVDSLSLYHSEPLTIALTAERQNDQAPFQFLLSNASNIFDVQGLYLFNSEQVDGSLSLDLSDVGMFSFLFADVMKDMKGALKGEATFNGPIEAPVVNGYLRFLDVDFTTVKPPFTFNVEDEKLMLDQSGIVFDDFALYDPDHHPLTVNGKLTTKNYMSYTYDLNVHTDEYALLNIPATAKDQLKGLLVVGSDIQLNGNEKDTYVKATITVKDTTHLIYTIAADEAQLLKTEGIIEFIDPEQIPDTASIEQPGTFYDSLITSLPDFNLSAVVTIQDDASLKVITNAQSGDFFEASGDTKLDLDYDRTGNAHLAGTYTINEGVYRISFYDLVKKNFSFVPGSSINWSGSPESGTLDIKAVRTVASNSIGLVGHEIGENEKSVYKRSLDYEVGINISGTVDKPIVAFSLDLPKEEKANYPVLANKLDRLKMPEFQTELNKQVFGLLVLGGFLPDASAMDVNSNQIATTALYNSVNSLLASQLNRFAGQYIKGVNIDVGIQSYADYSTPGGKTQTAMDFRVSKSILDERLSFEVGGDFDISTDQSGGNKGDNYRGDIAIIYDLTGNGDKQLKLFNNETYDIIYQEIRNTGISLVFIREFDKGEKRTKKEK
jgi:hypothetical protein